MLDEVRVAADVVGLRLGCARGPALGSAARLPLCREAAAAAAAEVVPGDLAARVRVAEVDPDEQGVLRVFFREYATCCGHLGRLFEAVETDRDRAQLGVREVHVLRKPPAQLGLNDRRESDERQSGGQRQSAYRERAKRALKAPSTLSLSLSLSLVAPAVGLRDIHTNLSE